MTDFRGFDPPEANFTPTPNQFFDDILGRFEPCVERVVGILIRATQGWRNDITGGRRIEAGLPLSEFVKRGLSQESARKGLRLAEEAGFIRKTQESTPRDPARYALRWADEKKQDQAIQMERRALGEKPRVLKYRVLKSRTLKNGTPYSKDSERNSESEKKKDSEEQTSNVGDDVNSVDEDGAGVGVFTRSINIQAAAIVAELRDHGSERRHRQLLEICDKHGLSHLSEFALKATRERQAVEGKKGVIERPGAYYQSILIRSLEDRQVFVPKAGEDDPDEVRRLARGSMGL